MPEVPYRKQTLDTPNPIARFAHRRRNQKAIDLSAEILSDGGVLLDFGCGVGDFLNEFSVVRPDAKLYGFDPYSRHGDGRYTAIDTIDDSLHHSVDVVTCFETLEHLTDDELMEFLQTVDQLLTPGGVLLISVPIIGGPTLLLKEANRVFLFRKRSSYSLRELAAASFIGRPAPRAPDVKVSHKGFDFRALSSQLEEHLAGDVSQYAPFRSLPWFLNSQVFQTYRPRRD